MLAFCICKYATCVRIMHLSSSYTCYRTRTTHVKLTPTEPRGCSQACMRTVFTTWFIAWSVNTAMRVTCLTSIMSYKQACMFHTLVSMHTPCMLHLHNQWYMHKTHDNMHTTYTRDIIGTYVRIDAHVLHASYVYRYACFM